VLTVVSPNGLDDLVLVAEHARLELDTRHCLSGERVEYL
jgi:hypothetical protein